MRGITPIVVLALVGTVIGATYWLGLVAAGVTPAGATAAIAAALVVAAGAIGITFT